MPGSTTQSRSSAWTASTRFMSRKSRQMPPRGALTWPSSEVPVPKRDHRHALGRAQPHDLLHLFGGLRKDHRVRRLVGDPGERVAVLLAHRLRGDEPVADRRRQRGDDALDRLAVAPEFLPGFGQRPSSACSLPQSGRGRGRSSARSAVCARDAACALHRARNLARVAAAQTAETMTRCSTASIPNPFSSRPSCRR